LAKNRYGWQKRAKELARKQKNDDKMKRRQNKATELTEEEVPEMAEEVMSDPVDPELQPSPKPHD
jgi:hypothetical protein